MGKEFFSVLDILIFFVFLFLLLVVNFLDRQHNNGSIRYFAWGHKRKMKFSIYVFTFFSIFVTGYVFFSLLEKPYIEGLWGIIKFFLYFLCLLFIALTYIVPLKTPFKNFHYPVLSLYEWFDRKYNRKIPKIRFIMGGAEIISRVGFLIVQFYIIGRTLSFFFNLSGDQELAIITIFAFIVILYSTFGGFKGLSFYDLWLFLFFWGAIFIVGWNILRFSSKNLINNFDIVKTHLKINFKNGLSDFNVALFSINELINYVFPRFYSSWYQRIILEKEDNDKISEENIKNTKNVFIVATCFVFMFFSLLVIISLTIYSQNQNLSKEEIFTYFISFCPNGVKGLICGGIIMLCLNICEAEINALSIVFENDIAPVIFIRKIEKHSVTSNYENTITYEHKVSKLYGARWKNIFSIFIGTIFFTGTIYFFKKKLFLEVILIFNLFYFAIVPAPMFLTILGYKMKIKSMILGMVCGVAVGFILSFLLPKETIFIFSLLANFLGIYFGEKFFK